MSTILKLNGHAITLLDLTNFRQTYQLPPEFGITLFEHKDYTGLGRVDHSGMALHDLRAAVMGAIPAKLPVNDLLDFMPRLANLFRVKLYEINEAVGLRPVEVDFAAAGFEDIGQAFAYAVLHARASRTAMVEFVKIYQDWLDSTVRVAHTEYRYLYRNQQWQIQILSTAYGRIGLVIQTTEGTFHVRDTTYACPVANYMSGLMQEMMAAVYQAVS
jgi:hypothetical protein